MTSGQILSITTVGYAWQATVMYPSCFTSRAAHKADLCPWKSISYKYFLKSFFGPETCNSWIQLGCQTQRSRHREIISPVRKANKQQTESIQRNQSEQNAPSVRSVNTCQLSIVNVSGVSRPVPLVSFHN